MAISTISNSGIAPSAGISTSKLGSGAILQIKSTNWNTVLNYSAADGTGQTLGAGWSVIPTNNYVNVTTTVANSKLMIMFSGNMTTGNGNNFSDWIGGFGFVADPAGGTNWSRIGSGQNLTYPNNVKFFSSRANTINTSSGADVYWILPLNANFLYSPSASAGATVRVAVEYFHYYSGAGHPNLVINTNYSSSGGVNSGGDVYQGSFATTLTVFEVAP